LNICTTNHVPVLTDSVSAAVYIRNPTRTLLGKWVLGCNGSRKLGSGFSVLANASYFSYPYFFSPFSG
jgi:hypothetical protein